MWNLKIVVCVTTLMQYQVSIDIMHKIDNILDKGIKLLEKLKFLMSYGLFKTYYNKLTKIFEIAQIS